MGLPAELFGGRGPTRWRKVSDTVAGFLRADGKLAPIYARAFGSDPEGQRFESSRSHQEQHLMGCCSFCYARILWGSKRRDSDSPCPALCIPRGRNAPVGRFQGAAWRILSGAPKSALQCTFAMRFCFYIILIFELFQLHIILISWERTDFQC